MSSDNISLTSPQKKRQASKYKLYLLGALFVVFLIILATLMSDKKVIKERSEKFSGVGAVNSKEAADVVMERRLRQIENRMKELQEVNKDLRGQIARTEAKVKDNESAWENGSLRVLNGENGEKKDLSSVEGVRVRPNNIPEGLVLPPKVRREDASKSGSDVRRRERSSPFIEQGDEFSNSAVTDEISNDEVRDEKRVKIADGESSNEPTIRLLSPESTEANSLLRTNKKVSAKSSLVKNKMAGFLPATTAIPIVIFTGIDAATGTSGQGNPQPVHFRIQDDGWMAGHGRYSLKDCNGQGSGYGDLSAQRVMVTVTRIVCLDVMSDRILETKIKGYLTDSDNIAGFRGPVKNREGAIAGKAFAASFVQGSAELLAANSTSITASDGLAVQSTNTGSALRGGFIGGTNSAAEMLADRYIKQMEAIMPTIPLEAGRRGVLHIQEGTVLEWSEYSDAFIEKIEPVKGVK